MLILKRRQTERFVRPRVFLVANPHEGFLEQPDHRGQDELA
jgi:hypothetical protein